MPVQSRAVWTLRAINGGFEDEINFDDTSFGWRLPSSTHGLRVSLDSTEPRSGKRSLRIDFAGGADTATPIVSQLILVQPNSRYTLGFAARTRDLATGGPPVMMVTDVSRSADRLLAVSKPLAQESSEWQDYAVDFATGEETRAVLISLRRQDCTPPCPVVGQLWLDDFSIKEQAPSK